MEKLYTAQATAIGGRNGRVESSDGIIKLDLRTPVISGGPKGNFSNPEQLFAAGYAACFDSALNMNARMNRIKVGETNVTAMVSLNKDDAEGFSISVELQVKVPGVDRATAEDLVKKAHRDCPYSKATRNNVDVKLTVLD